MTKRELIRKLERNGEFEKARQLRAHNSPLDEAVENLVGLPFDVASAVVCVAGKTVKTAASVVNVFNPFKW